jgi:Holliday junction resolvase RusA-like endonuclease
MSNTWTCRVDGDPVAWARPGFATRTRTGRSLRRPHAYTRDAQRKYKAKLDSAFSRQAYRYHLKPLDCPAQLTVQCFYRPVKGKQSGDICAVKPDADNAFKIVADSLERAGVVVNDSRFWRVVVEKRYADNPGVIVTLEWD